MLKSRWLFGTSFNLLVLLGGSLGPPIFIRLRLNTLQLAAGMTGLRLWLRPDSEGKANRVIARKSDGGFFFDTPQLA